MTKNKAASAFPEFRVSKTRKEAAEMCTEENRYGMMLRHMYEEHDRLDALYRERKKG